MDYNWVDTSKPNTRRATHYQFHAESLCFLTSARPVILSDHSSGISLEED